MAFLKSFIPVTLSVVCIGCESTDIQLAPPYTRPPVKIAEGKDLLANPLIMGSSLSVGLSPYTEGKIRPELSAPLSLTLKYHPEFTLTDASLVAYPGRDSIVQVNELTQSQLLSHSMVFALDLFAWDSVNAKYPNQCEAHLNSAKKFFGLIGQSEVVALVGNIPDIKNEAQGFIPTQCRVQLNNLIQGSCRQNVRCKFLDLENLWADLKHTGSFTVKDAEGKDLTYPIDQFFLDGLHPSILGTQWLSARLDELLK